MIEQQPHTGSQSRQFDPLRYCIFTTIALIGWVIGPAAAVALMSGLGIAAYWSAWRAGLRTSKCVLRDVRLVLAYLGLAFAGSAAAVVHGLLS